MTKEEILERSRRENLGKHDERELSAFGLACRWGMAAGGILCVILVLASKFLFDAPEVGLAAWLVYFTMQASVNLVLFRELGQKGKLWLGVFELVIALAYLAALIYKTMVA